MYSLLKEREKMNEWWHERYFFSHLHLLHAWDQHLATLGVILEYCTCIVLIHIFPITINMAPKHKLTTCTSYDVHPKKAELLEWFLNAISLWNETLKSQKSAADNLRPYQEIFVFLAAQKTAATVVNHHVFLEKKNLQKMSLHILTQLNQTHCVWHTFHHTHLAHHHLSWHQ